MEFGVEIRVRADVKTLQDLSGVIREVLIKVITNACPQTEAENETKGEVARLKGLREKPASEMMYVES